MRKNNIPKAIFYENDELVFLDQTKLPLQVVFEKQENIVQVWESIKTLKVRGAPAIGIAAAYGLLISAKPLLGESVSDFKNDLRKNASYLSSSRPTAVNLDYALNRMIKVCDDFIGSNTNDLYKNLISEAEVIYNNEVSVCRKIGQNGVPLIKNGSGVLTHCNAGALAVSEYGTALAPIYEAFDLGIEFKVYADETRPLLQGARLTAWELSQAGVDVTLICDDMAAYVLSKGLIDLVIVGCDRVAANGDTANKIGTLSVAVNAKYFNVPFYVACPYSTYDADTKDGGGIIIEERSGDEVTGFSTVRTAPIGVKTLNPAFDVTPNELITGFITEKGIIEKPFGENFKNYFKGK